ncbi:MAG: protein-disulfide reductase DsbD [Acidithiobacillus sp.]
MRFFLLLTFFLLIPGSAYAGSAFLAPAQAFRFVATMAPQNVVVLRWTAAPGYHLYRDRIRLRVTPTSAHFAPYTLPPGKWMTIPAVGRLQVYEGNMTLQVPLQFTGTPPKTVQVSSSFQGCANAGVCYPQITKTFSLATTALTGVARSAPSVPSPFVSPATVASAVSSAMRPTAVPMATAAGVEAQLAQGLQGGQAVWTLLLFFLAGLGLAFTPCIFPMIPILSALVVGHGDAEVHPRHARRHAFRVSLFYILGMSLTYTIAGVLAALTGSYLQAAFQNPWVLAGFSALFVLLALSMFGFYELQMPTAIQSRLSRYGKGGHFFSALMMGVLSALIVGPCVAAPLAGALLFIAHTGNVVLGGLALFLMGLGMGVPLLIIGTSAGHFLPKAGRWMDAVKDIFGVVLLGVAIWFLSRILPGSVTLALWSALAVITAVFIGAFSSSSPGTAGWSRFWQGVGLLLFAYGLALGAGALAGATRVLEPLAPFTNRGQVPMSSRHLPFQMVRSLPQLQAALAAAKGRPVLVDFWAKWCVECQRMDVTTYDNPRVEKTLRPFVLIRVDVTSSDAASRDLLRQYHLFGPPAVLLINPQGTMVASYEGYEGPNTLLQHLRQMLRKPSASR